jgi:hypothetical protein
MTRLDRDAAPLEQAARDGAAGAAADDGRAGTFRRISLVESVPLLPGVPGSVAVLGGTRA